MYKRDEHGNIIEQCGDHKLGQKFYVMKLNFRTKSVVDLKD